LNDFWEYDAIANSWVELTSFPGAGRSGASNFLINNKVYIVGGKLSDGTILQEVWEYNLNTQNWVEKNNLPINGMWKGIAFTINDTGYIACGLNNIGFNHHLYQYNQNSDSWRKVSNLTLPALGYAAAATCNQQGIIYGGQDSLNNISSQFLVYNPVDSSILVQAGIPSFARKGGVSFVIENVFYYSTGVSSSFRTKETWKYTGLIGLKKNEKQPVFRLFPNPTKRELNIMYTLQTPQNLTLIISDVKGKQLMIHHLNPNEMEDKIYLNDIHENFIFVTIYSEEKLLSAGKVIIE
jgi:hypothetical protein